MPIIPIDKALSSYEFTNTQVLKPKTVRGITNTLNVLSLPNFCGNETNNIPSELPMKKHYAINDI
jgi:hypothetical protein